MVKIGRLHLDCPWKKSQILSGVGDMAAEVFAVGDIASPTC